MYLFVQLSAVQEIENLHHHECVENESKVPRVNVMLIKNRGIIGFAINKIESTRAYCSCNDAILDFILVLGMPLKQSVVIFARVLGDKLVSQEYKN